MPYFLKRMLFFLPVLWLISIMVFALQSVAPGDPVTARFKENSGTERGVVVDGLLYQAKAKEMGLDKPLFYAGVRAKPVLFFYAPVAVWHGVDNQYHHWITRFLRGDLGVSWYDDQPVAEKLASPLAVTLFMSALAFIISFGIAIPLGVYMGAAKGSRWERRTSTFLFGAYSIPLFWLATLATIFLTNNSYGLKIASIGLEDLPAGTPLWGMLFVNLPHFILPVLCVSLHSLAYVARQMQAATADALRQEYIKTAKAKGASARTVLWRHAFRNALFPLITMAGQAFPALVAGSLVVEIIFNIPGMGWEAYKAFGRDDYPVVYAVAMLGSVLTLTGSLAADLIYQWANPRVQL